MSTTPGISIKRKRVFPTLVFARPERPAVAKRTCRAVNRRKKKKRGTKRQKITRACRSIVNKFGRPAGRARETLGDLCVSPTFNRRAAHCSLIKSCGQKLSHSRVRGATSFTERRAHGSFRGSRCRECARGIDPTCPVSIIKSLRHARARGRYRYTDTVTARAERYRSAVRVVHGAIYRGERLRLESCNRDSDCAAERCKLIVSLLSRLMGSILPGLIAREQDDACAPARRGTRREIFSVARLRLRDCTLREEEIYRGNRKYLLATNTTLVCSNVYIFTLGKRLCSNENF